MLTSYRALTVAMQSAQMRTDTGKEDLTPVQRDHLTGIEKHLAALEPSRSHKLLPMPPQPGDAPGERRVTVENAQGLTVRTKISAGVTTTTLAHHLPQRLFDGVSMTTAIIHDEKNPCRHTETVHRDAEGKVMFSESMTNGVSHPMPGMPPDTYQPAKASAGELHELTVPATVRKAECDRVAATPAQTPVFSL